MKILLLGKNGQLGWELHRSLASLGEVVALDYPEIDCSQPDSIRPNIREIQPQVLVNATAYTAVDRAETEPQLAHAINALAPAVMAEETSRLKATLFHVSTDYVFDGQKGSAYIETDSTHPLNVYGQTKLDGEQAVASLGGSWMTFRTSWVYSLRPGSLTGRDSFVAKVLQWSRQQKTLRLVSDQVSGPTWARLLAEIISQVLAMSASQPDPHKWLEERCGLYHLAGDGWGSRLEWGQAILKNDPHRQEQVTENILPALTVEFPSPAQRPLFSALDCRRFKEVFGLSLPDWKQALELAMESVNDR